MQAVILAGGKGTRLHPLTTNVPKPMVPLFDRPVMEHCIRLLAKHGITDIIVTVSHLASEIMQFFGDGSDMGVKIRYSVESTPLGTAGGVKLIQGMITGTFIVVSGDAVTDFDLTAAIRAHKSTSAIASLLLHEVDDPSDFGLVQHDDSGRIMRLLEKPKSTEIFTNMVNTGIYVLEPEVLSSAPYGEPCDFARQLFPRLLSNQEPVYGFEMPGYWCDVGNLAQYRNCHFDALMGKIDMAIPASSAGNGVWLGEGVEVDPSVELTAPVFLGNNVTIRRGATLGERTVIGADTLIEEDAHISHSVIGSRSLIGRNTKITDCIIGCGHTISDSEELCDRTLVTCEYSKPEQAKSPAPKATPTLAGMAREKVAREAA